MVLSNSTNERSSFLPSITVCSFGGTLLSRMSSSDVVLALAEFQVTPSDSIRAQRAQLLEELLGAQPAAPIVDSIMVFEGRLASSQGPEEEEASWLAKQRSLEEEVARVTSLLAEAVKAGENIEKAGEIDEVKKRPRRKGKKALAKNVVTSDSESGSTSDSSSEVEFKKSKFRPQSVIPILNTVSEDLDVNVNRVSVVLCEEVFGVFVFCGLRIWGW
jgi:hypothetical protein